MKLAFIHPPSLVDIVLPHTDILFVEALIYSKSTQLQRLLAGEQFNNPATRMKTVMLDHSAFLNGGKPIDLDAYISIIKQVKPNITILPDVLGNFKDTIAVLQNSYDVLKETIQSFGGQLMGCLQGNTISELQTLLDSYTYPLTVDLVGLTTKGLPSMLTENYPITRWRSELLSALKTFWTDKEWSAFKFHALGLLTVNELKHLALHAVVSNDSSLAVCSGLHLTHIRNARRMPLNFDFDRNSLEQSQIEQISTNMAFAKQLTKGT